MKAKEYFEGIPCRGGEDRQGAGNARTHEAREGAKAQSYHAGGGSGYAADPMDSIARRIDFEGRLEKRIAAAEEALDEACEVLYGKDGRGGLAKLKARGTQTQSAWDTCKLNRGLKSPISCSALSSGAMSFAMQVLCI